MRKAKISRYIDPRLQVKIKGSKEEEKTSIIVLSKGKEDEELIQGFKEHDVRIKYRLDIINGYAIELPCKCIERLALLPQVEFIADDAELSTLMDVARPTVGGRIAEDHQLTGEGIGIAILDTGVYPHADLTLRKNRIVAFKDFVNGKEFPYDDNGHGTHVAGVVAGDGTLSNGKYKGLAPKANIIGVKVMNKRGSGNTSDIVAGMQWILDNRERYNIRITSISLGSDPDLRESEDPLVKAVNALWDAGIVVVAAAGNSGPKQRTITSPGISKKIITIGSSDDHGTIDISDDTIADFSSRGPTRDRASKPDIVAPGVDINSLESDTEFLPKDGVKRYRFKLMEKPYTEMSGTSMATPIVSGAIALLLEREPRLSPDQVKRRITETAIPLKANSYAQGKGLLNLEKILNG